MALRLLFLLLPLADEPKSIAPFLRFEWQSKAASQSSFKGCDLCPPSDRRSSATRHEPLSTVLRLSTIKPHPRRLPGQRHHHFPSPVITNAAHAHARTAAPSQPSRAEMASAATPAPTWVILGSVPRVLSASAADADLPPGPGAADFSLALPAPPRVAVLTIPPRIFPGRTTPDNFPSVLAADPSSGLLLLHADQGPATGPTIIDTPDHQEFSWRPFVAGYFVLDAASRSALPLPKPELICHPGHLGLVACPDGDGYMVAELQPFFGGDTADLLRFSSQDGEWVSKSVAYPLPSRMLSPNGVVACSGRLWWVDLSWCLLTCDPFADAPALDVVPLPDGKALKSREAWGLLDKYRCVGVSAGKLRFVDMYRNRDTSGAAQISVWTLADHPESKEWTLEYEATFTEICNDGSYKATGLPRKIPVLALIDPTNPDIVYFFLDEHLLGVDVRARKVVGCEVYELVEPPRENVASRFVHAWQLPRALCSGPAEETAEDAAEEPPQQLNLYEYLKRSKLIC